MINPLLLPELREMLAEDDAEQLRVFCLELHPARTAEFIEGLSAKEAWRVLTYADLSTGAEIFGYLDEAKQIAIIETGDRQEIAPLIAELPADDRVDLMRQVDPQVVDQLLPLIPTKERRELLRLRSYPEETAGALMTTELAKLDESVSVKEALDELGRQAADLEIINYLYVVDAEDHLRGVVSARQLVSSLGKPELCMADLMERDVVTVHVTDDQERMAEKVARFDLLAIPVTDDENHLLGIITHDDVLDVFREEATEDVYKMAAVDPLEAGYMETHWFTLTKKRGVWIVFLFFTALLTALTLTGYGTDLRAVPWLVFFIPLVLSTGGNSGSQSAALVIRALTVGDITVHDWAKIIRRELMTGLCLGVFLGIVGYSAVLVLSAATAQQAVIIPITLVLVVLCGTLTGSLLPLLFQCLGLDPALMSNPFVSGISDIVGILIYMNVAMSVLGM